MSETTQALVVGPSTTGRSPTAPALAAVAARRRDVISGVSAMLPWLIGVMPFGMVVGMTARASGATMLGLLTGATIYSGSAQIIAIDLVGQGAAVVVVVTSVLIVNARLILFSSSIAPYWTTTGPWFRAAAAYLLVDPSYLVGMHRYQDDPSDPAGGHVHYLAAGITLWVAWHASMVAGAMLGAGLPDWLPLGHAVTLFLLAEVVQAVDSRPALTAAAVGGAVAVVGGALPLHSGLLVAAVTGVAAAVTVERWSR
jgi:predicted branched-subunit amino acid permease